MKIQVTYWGKKTPGPKVAICHSQPKGFKGVVLDLFKPPVCALRDAPGWREQYKRELETKFVDASDVLKYIESHVDSDIVYLTCWEKNPDECHRQVLMNYLNELGLAAGEYRGEQREMLW